jgi:hypothetical protein
LSNFVQTLHSLGKLKKYASNPKFEVSNSRNKKIGATISFPEGLEDTPFTDLTESVLTKPELVTCCYAFFGQNQRKRKIL